MATQILNGNGNLSNGSVFGAVEVGTGARTMLRANTTTLSSNSNVSSPTFTATNGKVFDGVLLWLYNNFGGTPTGTLLVEIQKGGVTQASVTVNSADLPWNNNGTGTAATVSVVQPVFFKFTSTATGDGGTNWTIKLTTSNANSGIVYSRNSATAGDMTKAIRTTTSGNPSANDDLYIVGALTGAGTHTSLTCTMDQVAGSIVQYGNGSVLSASVIGGEVACGCYGTLAFGTSASTNYYLQVKGNLYVTWKGELDIGTTVSTDPCWSDVTLRADFEGANNATAFSDQSTQTSGHGAATFGGSAKLSSTQFKYGSTALSLNGSTDYITWPDSSDWHWGSGTFTVEGWIYPTSVSGTQHIVGQWNIGTSLCWRLYLSGSVLNWDVSTNGSSALNDLSGGTVVVNTWQHVAVDYDGTTYRLYLNGAVVATSVTGRTISSASPPVLSFGRDTSNTNFYSGYMDDFRISSGCRYGVAFTTPAAAYPLGTGVCIPRTSTAVCELVMNSANGDFIIQGQALSTIKASGPTRTASRGIYKTTLTANVTTASVLGTSISTTNVTNTVGGSQDNALSVLASSAADTVTNATHIFSWAATGAVTATTQVGQILLARGSGTNNRFVRLIVGSSSAAAPTNGFFADIDLQAGTIGTCTAIGNGTATSASITALTNGFFLCTIVGKCSSGSATPNLVVAICSAAGTTSFAGAANQCLIYEGAQLVTASSIGDTTFSVADYTGWKSGDACAVAATTRNLADSETFVLSADAGLSSLVSHQYMFGCGGPTASAAGTHHGTTPLIAEIINLTRNIKIRSSTPTLQGYINIDQNCALNLLNAQIYWIGQNTAGKTGLIIQANAGSFTAATKSITYCSVHDTPRGLQVGNGSPNYSTGLTCSYNTWWNITVDYFLYYDNVFSLDSNWTYTYNTCMRGGTTAYNLADVGGTMTNNVLAGAANGWQIGNQSENLVVGTWADNVVHSCTGVPLFLNASGGNYVIATFTRPVFWRNNAAAVQYNNPTLCATDVVFDSPIWFGNVNGFAFTNSNPALTTSIRIIGTGIICSDTTYTQATNFTQAQNQAFFFEMHNVDLSGGAAYMNSIGAAATTEFNFNNGSGAIPFQVVRAKAINCHFGSGTLLGGEGKAAWDYRSYFTMQRYGQTAGDHRCEMTFGQFKTDTSIVNTAAQSLRMTPNSATHKLESAPNGTMAPPGLLVRVNSGDAINASAYIRESVVGDGAAYNGNAPRIIVRANSSVGITSDTVLATYSGAAGTFRATSGTSAFTCTDKGYVEIIFDCDGTAGWVNIAEVVVNGQSCDFSYFFNGVPALNPPALQNRLVSIQRGTPY
jgi:hypothetical protein